MDTTHDAALVEPWKELWNGDLTLTDQIIAEDLVARAAPLTGTGSDSLADADSLLFFQQLGIREVPVRG